MRRRAPFIAMLRGLVELASARRVLVVDDGDALVVTTQAVSFRLTIDHLGGSEE